MCTSLISRNDDLYKLKEAGYHLQLRGLYLIVHGIPYVTESGEIQSANIVTHLEVSGATGEESTLPPSDHTVWWTGGIPHRADGSNMDQYLSCGNWEQGHDIGEGITVRMQWSRKPKEAGRPRGYRDYYEKIVTYINEVAGEADGLRPGILDAARHGSEPLISSTTSSRFAYIDTSSYRNGTKGIESRIEDEVVAVIGVGGTGSYLVDVLAKTNIKELHLFDDDVMRIHNAFRVAGAARVGELNGRKTKLAWHVERYRNVRIEGLHPHDVRLTAENLDILRNCSTAFIAVDKLPVRRMIQKACSEMGVLHLSVGIGLEVEGENNDKIGGMVKVECDFNDLSRGPVDFNAFDDLDNEEDDVYRSNIQTAEVNMLGAAIAITEWKARRGIYRTERDESNDSIMYSLISGKITVDQKGDIGILEEVDTV